MDHLNLIGLLRGQDGRVSVVTYCGVQKPVDARGFIFSVLVSTGLGAHLLSFQWVVRGLFPGHDVAECAIDHPPLSSAKFKNEW